MTENDSVELRSLQCRLFDVDICEFEVVLWILLIRSYWVKFRLMLMFSSRSLPNYVHLAH